MPTRPAARAATAPRQAGYMALLRAAEANPDEVFTLPGEALATLLRDLSPPRRGGRRTPGQAS